MQFRLRTLLFAVLIAAGLVWSVGLGISRTRHNLEANQSEYAARLVAEMCVEHMRANRLAWPRNWEDLQDDFSTVARSGQSWTFSDLKKRVGVDWKVEPKQLLSDSHTKSVIWIASDPGRGFYGTSPNEIVSSYLASTNAVGE